MDADEIIDALIATASDQCIWCTELAYSSGRNRADFFTLHPHASKGYLAQAFEVKISRADFKRDSHKKQREARLFSDEFYYVTPPQLLKLEDVPDWAGLIEIHNGKRKVIHSAPRRDKDAPSWELVVSLIRNSGRIRRDEDVRLIELAYLKRVTADAKKKMREAGLEPWKFGIL